MYSVQVFYNAYSAPKPQLTLTTYPHNLPSQLTLTTYPHTFISM